MNRFLKRILSPLCLGVFALVIIFSSGCGSKGKKKVKIGISMDSFKDERWKNDRDLLVKRIEELGGEAIIQVADGNDQVQNQQIENLLTMGVEALIIVPHNGKTVATAVESAHKAGVKVISYDRLIRDCDVDFYISFDNVKVGELQAEYITKLQPKGNYILISGSPLDNNSFAFREGQMNVLKPFIERGDITLVVDQGAKDWQPIEALKHTENGLTKSNNNVVAVLAANDGLAGGVIQALTEQKLQGKIPVCGQDAELAACKRIIEGTQSMTVYKPITLLAYTAAQAAMNIATKQPLTNATRKINNGKTDVPSILLEPISVDKDNIEKTIIADGYHTRADVFAK